MNIDKEYMDGQKQKNFFSSLPSFDKKNTHSLIIVGLAFLLVGGYGVAQNAQGYDVSIGQNGIEIYSGSLDVQGNDIESSGTTVFDGSAGQIATAVVDYSAATASDVGLGNVENIALSTIGGNDITWDSNNNELDVDSSSIQSGTTASDVGLGSADNADELDLDGSESMNGNIDVGGNDITNMGDSVIGSDVAGVLDAVHTQTIDGVQWEMGRYLDPVEIRSEYGVVLKSDTDGGSGGSYECELRESDGVFECPQGKSWVHQINATHEAVYNSQESAKMRAVFEGSVYVESKKNVSLPQHFSQTVSDTEPLLRAVATPDKLTTVAVTEKTSEYIIIESTESVNVDYRVTGVRDGFENKQVIRKKK